jgi:ketosteroid isomerase-like protein
MNGRQDSEFEAIVRRFNDCITNRDIHGLAALIADDHTFIDSANAAIRGKENVLKAWRSFFESFPDYRNVFERLVRDGDAVKVVGYSTSSDSRLDGPALWTAKIADDKVTEWRVYEDTGENRKLLDLA